MAFIKLKILCWFICLYCVNCELNLDEGSACVSDGVKGKCVSVYRCEPAAKFYIYSNAGYDLPGLNSMFSDNLNQKQHVNDDFRFPEICNYKDGKPIVCCTHITIYADEEFKDYVVIVNGTLIKKVGPKALDKCLDYFQNLPYRCRGQSSSVVRTDMNKYKKRVVRQIANGRNATRGELPHMALLGYGDDQKDAMWTCAGSVISERYILTAAHCVYSNYLGAVNFAALGILKRNDMTQEYGKIYEIKNRIRHPDYRPPSTYHDIALLEMQTEINFGKNILPACLNTVDSNFAKADASGWGDLRDVTSPAETLQVGQLDLFSDEDCAMQFPVDPRYLSRGFDNTIQMCYGGLNSNVDTCRGDSGGPLLIHELHLGRSCRSTVIGVTAFGIRNCATLGAPGMFTRVSHYIPWIESIVWPD